MIRNWINWIRKQVVTWNALFNSLADGCSSGGSSAETPPPSSQYPLLERLDSCSLAGTLSLAGSGTAVTSCCESGAGLPTAAECGCAVSAGGACPAGQGGNLHQRQGSGDSNQHLRIHSSGSSHCDSASGSLKGSKRSSHKNPLNVSSYSVWVYIFFYLFYVWHWFVSLGLRVLKWHQG